MLTTRRTFIRRAAAVSVGVAAPGFLSDLARAQGGGRRVLVVLDLQGGNDSLSMAIPYGDPSYYSRRPTIAVPAGNVLPIGSDPAGRPIGLHPRLVGLRTLFVQGQLAIIQRVGYPNSSRSHFQGNDIWSTANPSAPQGPGWLGRYLDTLPAPVDPLTAWCGAGELPRTLMARAVTVPAIPSAASYTWSSPNSGAEATLERTIAQRMAASTPAGQAHVAFVNGSLTSALATLERVATVAAYVPTVMYPNTSLAQALRTVAGAMAKQVGTSVFWVQTGGYDNHASQGTNTFTGTYASLMGTLGDALAAFAADLSNQGLLGDMLLIQYSEFGRRITENGSQGTDHGAAGVMLALGGRVRGGIFGTAPVLTPAPGNSTLENAGNDVAYETDFRSVYTRVIEQWLGADPVALLGGSFRAPGLNFI